MSTSSDWWKHCSSTRRYSSVTGSQRPRWQHSTSVRCSEERGSTSTDDKAQQLRELTSRLPKAVRGDDEYWINRIREEAGMQIMFYFAEVLPQIAQTDENVTQVTASRDWLVFLRVMAAAIDRKRRANPEQGLQTFAHPGQDSFKPRTPTPPEQCSKNCPSHAGGECDIMGKPTAARLVELSDAPGRKR